MAELQKYIIQTVCAGWFIWSNLLNVEYTTVCMSVGSTERDELQDARDAMLPKQASAEEISMRSRKQSALGCLKCKGSKHLRSKRNFVPGLFGGAIESSWKLVGRSWQLGIQCICRQLTRLTSR